jgi:hypothetical protein
MPFATVTVCMTVAALATTFTSDLQCFVQYDTVCYRVVQPHN